MPDPVIPAPQEPADADPNEIAPGFAHEQLQGTVWEPADEESLRQGLEKAFDYRGDVTIRKANGSTVEGYLFDRRTGATLADSYVRLMPKDSSTKMSIAYTEIAGLAFTGRDTAAGKSWEAWVTKYWQKKAAGEQNIQLQPERLD